MTDALKDLPDAEYNGIRFPVERAEWQGGNDLVEHTAYRRPGADIEPTGRKPYRGSFVIPLINTPALVARYGQLFPGLRYDLVTAFEDRPIATLWHPTLGQLVAAIGDVSETASAEDRGGVRLTVQWVEHDASVALARGPDSPAPDAAQQGVTQRAERADVANKSIPGYQATKLTIAAGLAYLDAAPRTFTQTQSALRGMLAPVLANLLLPALSTASAHAAYVASANLVAALYALRNQLLPSPQRTRFYTTPAPMALWQVSLAVYGSTEWVTLLRSANGISNPLLVPAGRRLTVLPLPGR